MIVGDVGGAFGQKINVGREETALALAARVVAAPGEVDRRPLGEPRRGTARAVGGSRGVGRARRRRSHPRRARRPRVRRRRVRGWPRCRGPRRAADDRPLPHRAVPDREGGRLEHDRVDEHHAPRRLPRAVDVRDRGARDDRRHRGPPARPRPARAAPAEHHPGRRPALHDGGRHRPRPHHARRDPRAGRRPHRLRRVPARAGGGAGRRVVCSASASRATSSPLRAGSASGSPRPPPSASTSAARCRSSPA